MAGIISNVDSDVQKLRKLKNEIESVKKALKGINIKVDIDIAKGLQSQLTSLLGQYDTLVDKIAAAEGKIMLSASKINKATEKIVKAQEVVSKPAAAPAQNGGVVTQTNAAGTESVRAQAKAYEDLKAEINGVLGTRDENIKRMVEEMNAIRLINAEIKKITKTQGESSSLSSAQRKRLEQLNNSLLTHKEALSEVRQTLNNNVKLDNVAATSMKGLSQSLSRMRIAYRELTEEERNSPFGKELLASIKQADAKIKELDATIGNHQRNVGNYGAQWNGLSMSIQQLGRELPSLAYGPQVFFSAISNNLPILADEIRRARTEHELLKKSGQSAVPVWKQVASSLFSWQTALTVGITLLTLYGNKVVDWVGSLFKGKDALDEVVESQEEMKKRLEDEQRARKNAAQSVTSLLAEYKRLQEEYKSLNGNTQKQNKFVKDSQSEFQKLGVAVNDVTDAENLFIKNETAFINSLQHRAMAAAAMAQMETEYKKVIDRMVEMEDYVTSGGSQESKNMAQNMTDNYIASILKQKGVINSTRSAYPYIDLIKQGKWQLNKDLQGTGIDWTKEYNAYYQNQLSMIAGAEAADRFNRQTEEAKKNIETLAKVVRKESALAKESLDETGLKESENQSDNKLQQEQDKRLKQEEKLSEQLLSLRRKNQQDEINLMEDSREKKLAQIDLDYQKELDAIRKQEQEWRKDNGGKLTEEQTSLLGERASNNAKGREKAISAVNKEELEAQSEAMNRYLKEYGTFQQKKDAITKEYTAKIAKATTEWEKKILQKEKEAALSAVDMDKLKKEINWELVFSDLGKASKKSLDKVKSQLKAFKSSPEYKNMSVDQKKVIDEALNNIQSNIIDKGGLLGDLPNQLNELRIAQDELIRAQDEYNNALKNGTDREKEAALEKKNAAEQKLDNAKKNVNMGKDKAANNLLAIGDALNQLGSSSEMSLSQLGNATASLVSALSESGSKIGMIIAGILELLDTIGKVGIDKFVGNVFESLGHAVGGIMGADWNPWSWIGVDKLFKGADYSGYEAMKGRYNNLSAIWDELIDKKTKYIDISYGKEALNAGQEVLDIIKKSQDAQRNLAGALASSGSSAGSHSIAARQNRDLGGYASELYKYVSQNGNYNDITNALLGASAEQLQKVRDQMQEFWAGLDSDFQGHLNNIIKGEEQAEEVLEQMKKAVTGMGFDEFRNGYASLLADLSSSNKDFADNFEKQLQKSIFESLIANKYKDRIQELYDAWVDYGKDGMTSDEAKSLRDMQQRLSDSLLAERNKLMQDFGWQSETTSQSSTKGYSIAASQDSVDEVSGRLTALQIAEEEIKNQAIQQTDLLSSINEKISLLNLTNEDIPRLTANTPDIAGQTREILASSYQPQITINFPTDKIESLASDVSSLKGIVDELRTNQIEKFNDVVEGVSKMAKNTPVMNEKIDSINDNIKKAL